MKWIDHSNNISHKNDYDLSYFHISFVNWKFMICVSKSCHLLFDQKKNKNKKKNSQNLT